MNLVFAVGFLVFAYLLSGIVSYCDRCDGTSSYFAYTPLTPSVLFCCLNVMWWRISGLLGACHLDQMVAGWVLRGLFQVPTLCGLHSLDDVQEGNGLHCVMRIMTH